MSDESLTIGETVTLLREHYGPPSPMPTADAFELILWENVAYLATPARRREAFDELKRTVGTDPESLIAADQSALERVAARGILKNTFAEKLRKCARIALEEFGGDLEAVIRGPLDKAKRALRSFPASVSPAQKILAVQRPVRLPGSRIEWSASARPTWSGPGGEVVLTDVCREPSSREGTVRGAERDSRGSSAPPAPWPDAVQAGKSAVRKVPPVDRLCPCSCEPLVGPSCWRISVGGCDFGPPPRSLISKR